MATLLVQCEGGLLWNRSSSLLAITNFNQIQFIFIVFLVHFFIVAFSNYTIKKKLLAYSNIRKIVVWQHCYDIHIVHFA